MTKKGGQHGKGSIDGDDKVRKTILEAQEPDERQTFLKGVGLYRMFRDERYYKEGKMAKKHLDFPHRPRLTYDDICEKIGFNEPVTIYFNNGLSRTGRLHQKYMMFFEGCQFVWEGQFRFRVVEWPKPKGREEE